MNKNNSIGTIFCIDEIEFVRSSIGEHYKTTHGTFVGSNIYIDVNLNAILTDVSNHEFSHSIIHTFRNSEVLQIMSNFLQRCTANSIEGVSKIISAYAKNNTQNFVNSSPILWINPDKKRASKWMFSFGLQLPSATSTMDSPIDNSITQESPVVNSNIRENSK